MEAWEHRDLIARIDELENDMAANRALLVSLMQIFLQASPEGSSAARFDMICENAACMCGDEAKLKALRRIVVWEEELKGFRLLNVGI